LSVNHHGIHPEDIQIVRLTLFSLFLDLWRKLQLNIFTYTSINYDTSLYNDVAPLLFCIFVHFTFEDNRLYIIKFEIHLMINTFVLEDQSNYVDEEMPNKI